MHKLSEREMVCLSEDHGTRSAAHESSRSLSLTQRFSDESQKAAKLNEQRKNNDRKLQKLPFARFVCLFVRSFVRSLLGLWTNERRRR